MSRQKGQKCGNCRFFQVRNDAEVELAKIAKDESECAPGEWVFEGQRKVGCHGGPVRGLCAKWQERNAPGPAILSTQWCEFWQEGGPVIRGAGAGSPNIAGEPASPPSGVRSAVDRNSNVITIALVGLLAGIGAWRRR